MMVATGRFAKRIAIAAAGVLAASSSLAIGQAGQELTPASAMPEAEIASAAAALATGLRAELAGLGADATAEDMEASLVFVIGQGDYPEPVIEGALNLIDTPDATPQLKQAIANVRAALLRRKLRRGTAALLLGGGGGTGSASFSGPIIGVGGGGGGSNYGS
jgi:hypothetical protein